MPVRLEERFTVGAPVGRAWEFLIDPRRVVTCVPGGELTAILDDCTYDGRVRVRVGPLVLAYEGRVWLAEVDAANRRVTILGDARETAGTDSARLRLESWLLPQATGGTEVVAIARIDVEGRIVELGRGVLEALGHVVFQDFAACVRARVEAEAAGQDGAAAALPCQSAPLSAFPLVLRALRAWAGGFWARRRAGRARSPPHADGRPHATANPSERKELP